jgi:hypothetical protein
MAPDGVPQILGESGASLTLSRHHATATITNSIKKAEQDVQSSLNWNVLSLDCRN